MISLRPFDPEDIATVLSWVDSEAAMIQWSGLSFSWPLTEDQLLAYCETARRPNSPVRAWTAIENATGSIAGHGALANIHPRHGLATVSRVFIAPNRRSRGLCRALISEVLRIGFEDMGMRRINLAVYDFNQPAIRCYEQCGFLREGVWREFAQLGDEKWTLIWMAILRHEWDARQVGGR